jgi:hypothetical protein
LNRFIKTFSSILLVIFWIPGIAQVRISGKVFDITEKSPLEAVSVLSSAGNGTVTNSEGRYSIVVNLKDSIWFSYLNKGTIHYPVSKIVNQQAFDIALHVTSTVLKDIRFSPKNYKLDSIQNRLDYAKAFNFQKPSFGTSLSPGNGAGVGLDINELIGMFQFRKNRRMLAFQERLLAEEEDRFIYHRFSRPLVVKLTGMRGGELDTFMLKYKPELEFVQFSTDYELQQYIKTSYGRYQRYKKMIGDFRKENE